MRFGSLLAESFACEMTRDLRERPGRKASFGSMDDVPFGLILNTGLTGEFTAEAYDSVHTVAEQARREWGQPVRRYEIWKSPRGARARAYRERQGELRPFRAGAKDRAGTGREAA